MLTMLYLTSTVKNNNPNTRKANATQQYTRIHVYLFIFTLEKPHKNNASTGGNNTQIRSTCSNTSTQTAYTYMSIACFHLQL